jgi:hypothetical protein
VVVVVDDDGLPGHCFVPAHIFSGDQPSVCLLVLYEYFGDLASIESGWPQGGDFFDETREIVDSDPLPFFEQSPFGGEYRRDLRGAGENRLEEL